MTFSSPCIVLASVVHHCAIWDNREAVTQSTGMWQAGMIGSEDDLALSTSRCFGVASPPGRVRRRGPGGCLFGELGAGLGGSRPHQGGRDALATAGKMP